MIVSPTWRVLPGRFSLLTWSGGSLTLAGQIKTQIRTSSLSTTTLSGLNMALRVSLRGYPRRVPRISFCQAQLTAICRSTLSWTSEGIWGGDLGRGISVMPGTGPLQSTLRPIQGSLSSSIVSRDDLIIMRSSSRGRRFASRSNKINDLGF